MFGTAELPQSILLGDWQLAGATSIDPPASPAAPQEQTHREIHAI